MSDDLIPEAAWDVVAAGPGSLASVFHLANTSDNVARDASTLIEISVEVAAPHIAKAAREDVLRGVRELAEKAENDRYSLLCSASREYNPEIRRRLTAYARVHGAYADTLRGIADEDAR